MFKFNLFTFILIVYSQISNGQIIFHKAYPDQMNGSMGMEMGFIEAKDKGFLLGNGKTLMKVDSTGSKEWRYEFDSPVNPFICVFSIINDFSKGYLLCGTRMFLSLDSSYNINWMKDISSSYRFFILESKKADSVTFIHAGEAGIGNDFTPCLLKTDTSGNIIWAKIYNSNPVIESIRSMEVASDGSIYVSGVSRSVINTTALHYDGVVFKLNSMGAVQWSKRYANMGLDIYLYRIKQALDGNLILSGSRNFKPHLMKIDTSGNILWEKIYSAGFHGNAHDVFCTTDNGFALVGEVTDTTMGWLGQTSIFIKTDSIGDLEWAKYMGGFGNVSASKIIGTTDKGYAIAGRRIYGSDYVLNLIKTDSLGNTGGCLDANTNVTITNYNDSVMNFALTDSSISATTVPYFSNFPLIGTEVDICNFQGDAENDLSSEISIYPNPANEIITITGLNTNSNKRQVIKLNDMTGRTIIIQPLNTDNEKQEINISCLSSGSYILSIESDGLNIQNKKVMITK
ncbi:MAG: T9SS type A sorting domain-containing protein [Bacteroidetes bacterium]|nr:T9SS type A sorting domain-containing protein [Bacteroidota bacterium]